LYRVTRQNMSGQLGGITWKSSKDFHKRKLRFRAEWGNHNSVQGNTSVAVD
jgi:hypothetical protein